jgi:phenylpropionate dioxygenase-like ring-hydroxylating dioxygenase large terminal subunit
MSEAAESAWWVPVTVAAALQPAAPLAVQRCAQPLVLWHDGQSPRAFNDQCPHRGAQLSLGRVVAGELECPYHGWRFAGSGQCVAVPALPGFVPPSGHRACAWQARQAHGLIWVAGPAAPGAEPLLPPALEDLPPRRVLCGPYEVATSALRVVENFLDTAHFGLVHEGWLGDRTHLQVPDYAVVHDAHGRPGVPAYTAWQPQASTAATGGAWVDYRYQVLSPFSALLHKKAQGDAPQEAYALWACPLSPESCRVWFTIFTTDTQRSDAQLIEFQTSIFAQDKPVLESQRPRLLPLAGGELHCAADRLSTAYRRWLLACGIGFGAC